MAAAAAMARAGWSRGVSKLAATCPCALVVADEAAVAAAAEGQREGVEEDGLAGPGLAGQDAEAVGEVQLQPVDQDDVADRKLDQHPVGKLSG